MASRRALAAADDRFVKPEATRRRVEISGRPAEGEELLISVEVRGRDGRGRRGRSRRMPLLSASSIAAGTPTGGGPPSPPPSSTSDRSGRRASRKRRRPGAAVAVAAAAFQAAAILARSSNAEASSAAEAAAGPPPHRLAPRWAFEPDGAADAAGDAAAFAQSASPDAFVRDGDAPAREERRWWDPNSFDYYDRLRESLRAGWVGNGASTDGAAGGGDAPRGGAPAAVRSVRRREGSPVVEVAVDGAADGAADRAEEGAAPKASRGAPPNATGTETYRLVHLPAILPFTGVDLSPRWDIINSAKAALMAAWHFNTGNNAVVPQLGRYRRPPGAPGEEGGGCNVRLTVSLNNSARSPLRSSELLASFILPAPFPYEPAAVLGAARSAVSAPLAMLNGAAGVPQVSHISTSMDLDNRDNYPTFGRVIPSARGDARAAVDYLARLAERAAAAASSSASGGGVGAAGGGSGAKPPLALTHFAIVHVRDSYGTSYAGALRDAASALGIQTSSHAYVFDQSSAGMGSALDRIEDAVAGVKRSGYRYVVAVAFQSHLEAMLEAAADAGVVGPGYFWLFGDGLSVTSIRERWRVPAGGKLAEAARGVGIIYPGVNDRGENYGRFMRAWRDLDETGGSGRGEFREYFWSKQPADFDVDPGRTFSDEPSIKAMLLYDAVMALGIAACLEPNGGDNVGEAGDGGNGGGDDGYFFTGPELFDRFARRLGPGDDSSAGGRGGGGGHAFDGASGRVEIDPSTGARDYRTTVYTVHNVVPDPPGEADANGNVGFRVRRAAQYLPVQDGGTGGTTAAAWVDTGPYMYADGTGSPPPPLPALEEDPNLIGAGLRIFGLALGGLVMLLSVSSAVWTFANVQSPVVRSSQPIFLVMICAGSFVMGMAFVPMVFEEPPVQSQRVMNWSCMAGWWFFAVGFTLMFSALYSKTLRINKIMFHPQFRRITVTPRDVLRPCVLMMGANLAVMTWQIVSPFAYVRSFDYASSSVDEFGRPTSSAGFCVSQPGKVNAYLFVVLALFLNFSVLAVASFQMFRARNITTEFSETRYITIAMIVLLQTFLIGIPMLVASGSTRAIFIVKAFNVFMSSGVTLLFIFVPKVAIWREHTTKMRALRESRARRQRHLNNLRERIEGNLAAIRSDDALDGGGPGSSNDGSSFSSPSRIEFGTVIIDEREEREQVKETLAERQRENESIRQRNESLNAQIEVLSDVLSCTSTLRSRRESLGSVCLGDPSIDAVAPTRVSPQRQLSRKCSLSFEHALGVVEESYEGNESDMTLRI